MPLNNLPTTNKYKWKTKDLFLDSEVKIDNYFRDKKQKLLNDLDQTDGTTSMLSLLPEPWSMKDLRKAAERILLAIENGEKITIFGDYDVDGTTSCSMLQIFFLELNYPVDIYIPDRLTEGYGLNPKGVQKLYENGTKLIITVDNGIAAHIGCDEANSYHIDVIITDHHDIPATLPKAFAILNPKQRDCFFPFKMLAGVGVAFYLMIALRSLLREKNYFYPKIILKNYLDFVAIGTIADMAPLNGVNHILCKLGLEVLYENLQLRPGISELLKLSGWDGRSKVTAADVGFKIGPRLNAAGRLGNALRSVEVLNSQNINDAKISAKFLHEENAERQQLEKKFTKEALHLAAENKLHEANSIVLHQEHWHSGVVGLVASRVLEKFYRPTLIFGSLDGKLKGSGRSTHSFNLFAALDEVRHEFISFGGHFHAVGITLAPEKLSWLCDYLEKKCKELILPEDKIPPLFLDGKLPLQKFDLPFISSLENFEPYGIANPRSKWLIGPLQIKHVRRIGKDLSQGHAKILFLEQGQEFWLTAFGMADEFENLLAHGLDVHVVVEAKRGYWNDREYVDFSLVDFAPVVYFKQ